MWRLKQNQDMQSLTSSWRECARVEGEAFTDDGTDKCARVELSKPNRMSKRGTLLRLKEVRGQSLIYDSVCGLKFTVAGSAKCVERVVCVDFKSRWTRTTKVVTKFSASLWQST